MGKRLCFSHRVDRGGIGRVRENRDACDGGHQFFEEFQPLSQQLDRKGGQTRDVAPRLGQAGDEPPSDRVARARKDNGDGLSRLLGGADDGLSPRHHEDIDGQPDQLGRQCGQPLESPLRKSPGQDEVLAFMAELTQALPEGLGRPLHER
jgi:hypothetical protein